MTEYFEITSRENKKLKHVRRVRDRKETGEIFIEGARLVGEALNSELELTDVFVDESFASHERNGALLEKVGERLLIINHLSVPLFRTIADTENSQGIILLAKRPAKGELPAAIPWKLGDLPLVLFLERAANPSNLGAIVRSADAAGVGLILVSKESADPYAPKALRASMGSAFRVPIIEGTTLPDSMDWANSLGMRTIAADVDADRSYLEIDWTGPHLLVFGSEAEGISSEDLRKLDETILIPLKNGVESLNLAVSCGIILFEAKRQNENPESYRAGASDPAGVPL